MCLLQSHRAIRCIFYWVKGCRCYPSPVWKNIVSFFYNESQPLTVPPSLCSLFYLHAASIEKTDRRTKQPACNFVPFYFTQWVSRFFTVTGWQSFPNWIISICFSNHLSFISCASRAILKAHANYLLHTSHSIASWRYLPARSSPGSVPPIPACAATNLRPRPV